MMTLYGIPNCDTVKRARTRLAEAGIDFVFHDFKKQGLSVQTAQGWIDALGLDVVLNRKGTTWRKLDEAQRNAVTAANAAELLAAQPSLVKRPVIDSGKELMVGFAKSEEEALIARLKAA